MVFRIVNRLIRALRIWYHGSTRDESAHKNDVKTVDDLPSTCLRGLRRKDWVDDDGLVATIAFIPDPKTAEQRQDRGLETSVNWEDDSSVEGFTLADYSNAQHGAARISTADIEHTSLTARAVDRPLSCERKPQASNLYHGNIVYSAGAHKVVQKQLAATLALKSRLVPPAR